MVGRWTLIWLLRPSARQIALAVFNSQQQSQTTQFNLTTPLVRVFPFLNEAQASLNGKLTMLDGIPRKPTTATRHLTIKSVHHLASVGIRARPRLLSSRQIQLLAHAWMGTPGLRRLGREISQILQRN